MIVAMSLAYAMSLSVVGLIRIGRQSRRHPLPRLVAFRASDL